MYTTPEQSVMGHRHMVLWSAEAKFRNGSDHLETLKTQLLGWTKRNSLAVSIEQNADSTQHSVVYRWSEPPPVIAWSLLVGDCLHNLRSSLDHAIYGLAVAKSGTDPPPHADFLAFPICDKPAQFADALDKQQRLGDMASDATLRTSVEDLQPYRRPDPPNKPWLGSLRDLENGDKHKAVTIIASAVLSGDIQFNTLAGYRPPTTTIRTRSPIEEKTTVLTLTFDRPAPDVKVSAPQLSVFPAIELDRLDGTTNAIFPVALLSATRDEVRDCLDALSRLI